MNKLATSREKLNEVYGKQKIDEAVADGILVPVGNEDMLINKADLVICENCGEWCSMNAAYGDGEWCENCVPY